jgi:MoaA/NifB/PqqE/SkfB family radical SAM enzyme
MMVNFVFFQNYKFKFIMLTEIGIYVIHQMIEIPASTTIYYYITTTCNLHCKHCYFGDYLSKNQFVNKEQFCLELDRLKNDKHKKIVLLGGEPTLHPDYPELLKIASQKGFSEITVDTNACANFPLPVGIEIRDKLKIRISFESHESRVHDYLRGSGSFDRAQGTLKKLAQANSPIEITTTLNRINKNCFPGIVDFFSSFGVHEFNFHFISMMGNAKVNKELQLEAFEIIELQDRLEELACNRSVAIRYPKVLVREKDFQSQFQKGFTCRKQLQNTELIMPDGKQYKCPLELESRDDGSTCPLSRLIVKGEVPKEYRALCISWKN